MKVDKRSLALGLGIGIAAMVCLGAAKPMPEILPLRFVIREVTRDGGKIRR